MFDIYLYKFMAGHTTPTSPPPSINSKPQPLIMADRIKEVAVSEADRIKSLASDAARSGAYLYPLRVSNLGTYAAGDHTSIVPYSVRHG